jgi:hypothetical protein
VGNEPKQEARTFGLLCGIMGCPFLPSVFASFFLANSCVWGCRAVCATAADLLPGAPAGRTKPVAKLKQAMQLTAMEINLIRSQECSRRGSCWCTTKTLVSELRATPVGVSIAYRAVSRSRSILQPCQGKTSSAAHKSLRNNGSKQPDWLSCVITLHAKLSSFALLA